MSRLIDADVFEVVCFQGRSDEFLEGAKYILEMIDAQPTAYNVDAVVAELKETNKNEVNAGMCPSGFIHCLTAIDIVRKGGVE